MRVADKISRFILKTIYICIFIIITMAVESWSYEYYVAKNGNDDNEGSLSSPWLTIQKASNTVIPGDIVFIMSGTYNEILTINHSGTEENYITIQAYTGHKVIIDGTGNAGWHGVLNIQGKRYIRIKDIEIRNNNIGWGVLIEHELGNPNNSAAYVELSGLEVHHTGSEGIQVRGHATDIIIQNSVVHDSIGQSGIDIYQWDGGRPRRVTVTRCTTYNCANFAGIASEQADSLLIDNNIVRNNKIGIDIGSGDNNVIRNNQVFNSATGIALSSNEDSNVYNNIIHDIGDEAIYSYYWSAHSENHARNKWFNNIIFNTGFGIFESNSKPNHGEGISTDHQYYNNVFYNIGKHGSYRIPLYFKGVTGIKFHHNTIFMNPNYDALQLLSGASGASILNNIISISGSKTAIVIDSTSITGSTIDYNCYQNLSGSMTGIGSHSIIGDPKFVNAGNGNFRLLLASPCIDAGISITGMPDMDAEGHARCDHPAKQNYGSGLHSYYDMGAYEYQCTNKVPESPVEININK